MGFEALAWVHYFKGTDEPEDFFSEKYDHVRAWAWEGQPHQAVRPVLRRMSDKLSAEFESRLWNFSDGLSYELKLFGDWYVMSLTSAPEKTAIDLKNWSTHDTHQIWCVTNQFIPFSDL